MPRFAVVSSIFEFVRRGHLFLCESVCVLPVVCVIAYGEMRRCYEYFEVIPLFDLAAIAIAIGLKRLCEV